MCTNSYVITNPHCRQAENKKLKKDLSASKSKENARRKSLEAKDDRIAYLKEPIEDLQVEIKKLKKLAYVSRPPELLPHTSSS